MDKEKELILKARVLTLEKYLQKVFLALEETIEIIVGKEHSTRNIGLRDVERRVKKNLKEFRGDLEYQNKS